MYRAVAAIIIKRNPITITEIVDNSIRSLTRKPTESLYLFVKKPRKHNAWQFPQGGLDPGETATQAALRELSEKCGTDIQARLLDEKPLFTYQYRYPETFKSKHGFIGSRVDFVRAEWIRGQCQPDNHEIVDFAWLAVDELDQYIDNAMYKELIKKYL
ncbi:NUDIX hydrolase domain-like protein [Fennellomyces sp. T-0311]|nr:NUDIX hydrolase domain-like protein [Fennellomyces sp. T-0311]